MKTIQDIEKLLKDPNISPAFKKKLEEKKRILTDNKTVKK